MVKNVKKAKLDAITKEIWIGVTLLIIFLLMFYSTTTIVTKVSDGVVTARFFPYLISGCGSVLSALLVLFNLIKKYGAKGKVAQAKQAAVANEAAQANKTAETNEAAEHIDSPIRWGMIALSIVFMIIYLLLMDILGFIVSSGLYLLVQILVLQQNKTVKRVIMVVVISIVTPVLIYLPFRYIFSLVLPLGIFR